MDNKQIKILSDFIQSERANNYAIHFQARECVKSMDPTQSAALAETADHCLSFPLLNILGASFSGWMPAATLKIVSRSNLIHIFNPWYLSDDGWAGFQTLWKALPEPEDLSISLWISVKNLLITCGKPVDNSHKTCGQLTDNPATYPQTCGQTAAHNSKINKVIHRLLINQ